MSPRPKAATPRLAVASVRLTETERSDMEEAAAALDLGSVSEYVRYLHSQHTERSRLAKPMPARKWPKPKRYAAPSSNGKMYHGDSRGLLLTMLDPESVDLIMTSPPFGLVRKKAYGNENADEYLDWFRPFAEGMHRVLKPHGSAVIDIGGAWKPGIPTRSTYHFELIVMLCREYGFHLAQEHFWWNPAKLPAPAEWVNIRRVRVKDAINAVWWISKTPWPKASNRRVLAPYSDAMEALLKYGYKAKLRPSGHDISEKFARRNPGAVPPNLLAIANTESNGRYQTYCKERGITPHPARFPSALPEYFIRMLTDRGDLVVDPFAGSCVTGEVAEALERRWIACDSDADYLAGALGRFEESPRILKKAEKYSIQPPVMLPDEDAPLAADGGATRPTLSAVDAQNAMPDASDENVATNGAVA